jgi:hypothetical protein
MPYHDLLLVIYPPNVEDGGSNIDAIAFVQTTNAKSLAVRESIAKSYLPC